MRSLTLFLVSALAALVAFSAPSVATANKRHSTKVTVPLSPERRAELHLSLQRAAVAFQHRKFTPSVTSVPDDDEEDDEMAPGAATNGTRDGAPAIHLPYNGKS